MNLYIACLHHDKREAVFGVFAADEEAARKKVMGSNTGWTLDKLILKNEPTAFRVFDNSWYEAETGESVVPEARPNAEITTELLKLAYELFTTDPSSGTDDVGTDAWAWCERTRTHLNALCPYPICDDDGSQKDCIAKGHCGCIYGPTLAPSPQRRKETSK